MQYAPELFKEYIQPIKDIIEGLKSKVDLSKLELTSNEKELLKTIPKDVVKRINQIMNRYNPISSDLDIRQIFIQKAIVELLKVSKYVVEAFRHGYDFEQKMEKING